MGMFWDLPLGGEKQPEIKQMADLFAPRSMKIDLFKTKDKPKDKDAAKGDDAEMRALVVKERKGEKLSDEEKAKLAKWRKSREGHGDAAELAKIKKELDDAKKEIEKMKAAKDVALKDWKAETVEAEEAAEKSAGIIKRQREALFATIGCLTGANKERFFDSILQIAKDALA